MEFCKEHTKLVGTLSALKQSIDNSTDRIERLDNRINGSFERINKHVSEGDVYRDKLIKLETIVSLAANEKLNTTKNSQYRIGIIVGVIIAVANILWRVVERFVFK